MADFIKAGKAHNRRTNKYIAQIRELFKQTNRNLVSIASLVPVNLNQVFRFRDNVLANNRANREIDSLISNIILLLRESSTSEQEAASGLIDELLSEMPEAIRNYQPFRETETVETETNIEIKVREYVNEYLPVVELNIDTGRHNDYTNTRIVGMLDYSLTRPWPTIRRTEEKIDQTNNVALAAGSLLLLSQGGLVNGGIGHYKSSFKNISRLTHTTIHSDYLQSLEYRFNEIDFIVGYEVVRGSNYDCPICNYMPGLYNKNFVFRSFHPNCYCKAIPRLCTTEEMEISAQRIEQGLQPLRPEQSSRYVSDIPKSVYRFVDDNRDKIARAIRRGTAPEFIIQNPSFFSVNDILYPQ